MILNWIQKHKVEISMFTSLLPLLMFFLFEVAANAQAPVRASYDGPQPFTPDPASPGNWKWTGVTNAEGIATRTIYNPLDGGVLLKYTASIADSDGCSAGAPREKALYQQPCFAHDTDYDAPFPLAGFPTYPDFGSTGQDISDFLLFKDMQLINSDASANNSGLINFINDSAANSFYAAVTVGGTFRGSSVGKTVLAKGGVIAVVNKGLYLMKLDVSWIGPDGTHRSYSVTKPSGWAAVVPLSVGATNILAACSAVGGTNIFSKFWPGPGMYAYTVHGTTLIHSVTDGLSNTLQTHTPLDLIKYNFSVKTADKTGAGTDSNMTVTIIGDQGQTTAKVVNPLISGNAFERNQTDTFTLADPIDVGKITGLTIQSDMKYAGAAWDLDSIVITKPNGDKSTFPINTHIADTNPRTFAPAANNTDYHFTVKTADLTGAGTDSNISYTIFGSQGPTVAQVSNPAISGNAYERNQTDTFTLSYAQDVGTIRNLMIQSDETGLGSAWDIEYIIIQKDGDPHSYVFQIHAEINDTNPHTFNVSEVRN
jgi:hypothetical protein